MQLLLFVWFSGSDNTLLEPGRKLKSRNPKSILLQILFLITIAMVLCNGPKQKTFNSSLISFHFFFTLFSFAKMYSPYPSPVIISLSLNSLSFSHSYTVNTHHCWFCITRINQLEVNNCLPLQFSHDILRWGGLSWKCNLFYHIFHCLNTLILSLILTMIVQLR